MKREEFKKGMVPSKSLAAERNHIYCYCLFDMQVFL
jgi:hypothetical protein